MKRFIIEVPDAALNRIEKGLRCKASVFMLDKGILGMKLYKYQVGWHNKTVKIRDLEYGSVRATDYNYIVHERLPRAMGPVQMMYAIDHDMNKAKDAILDNEIINHI